MIIPMFRLEALKRTKPEFAAAVIQAGVRRVDFLNIGEGQYYTIAKAHNVDYLEAKQIVTGASKLVTGAKMVAGFAATTAQAVVAVAQGKPALCTPKEKQERMTICAGCQFFIKAEQRCSECGCKRNRFIDKWDMVQAMCPKHKWPVL